MKRIAKITLGLGITLFLAGMMTGCGKTEIGYILTNPEKYVGKEVTIEGWAIHNLFEIKEYEVKKAKAEEEYERRRGLPPLQRGLPPVYVRPEEFNFISSIHGSSRWIGTTIAAAGLERSSGNKKAGVISAKYEISPPESDRMVRATGTIKLKEEYGDLTPVLVVKSWKYIQSSEQNAREKYKEHIIK